MTQQQAETFNKRPGMTSVTTASGGKIWTPQQQVAKQQQKAQPVKPTNHILTD